MPSAQETGAQLEQPQGITHTPLLRKQWRQEICLASSSCMKRKKVCYFQHDLTLHLHHVYCVQGRTQPGTPHHPSLKKKAKIFQLENMVYSAM